MEIRSHNIVSLRDMLVLEGKKIVYVEDNIEKALSGWILKIGTRVLKEELEHYLFDIRSHQKDFSDFIRSNNSTEIDFQNKVVNAYIAETNDKLSACAGTAISDACLIYAIQAINHYKINIYGTLASYADILGQRKEAEIYHKALLDEKVTDIRLSNIAERNVNAYAQDIC